MADFSVELSELEEEGFPYFDVGYGDVDFVVQSVNETPEEIVTISLPSEKLSANMPCEFSDDFTSYALGPLTTPWIDTDPMTIYYGTYYYRPTWTSYRFYESLAWADGNGNLISPDPKNSRNITAMIPILGCADEQCFYWTSETTSFLSPSYFVLQDTNSTTLLQIYWVYTWRLLRVKVSHYTGQEAPRIRDFDFGQYENDATIAWTKIGFELGSSILKVRVGFSDDSVLTRDINHGGEPLSRPAYVGFVGLPQGGS